MTIPLEVLAAEVLGLPPEERLELLDRLLASLEPKPFDSAWEQEWAAEIDRREADIEAGRAQWIPGEKAVARIRAQLK